MNGNIRTEQLRMPCEWSQLINDTIKKIEENGYPQKVYLTEIMRLLIHFRPAREHVNKALEEIKNGFKGVQRVRPEVEKIMKGTGLNGTPMEDI